MTYGKISKKQQEILEYIKSEILNRGFPPAVREICEAVNLKSTSSVHAHLEALEKNGYIRRDATKPRAIEIIDGFRPDGLVLQQGRLRQGRRRSDPGAHVGRLLRGRQEDSRRGQTLSYFIALFHHYSTS